MEEMIIHMHILPFQLGPFFCAPLAPPPIHFNIVIAPWCVTSWTDL